MSGAGRSPADPRGDRLRRRIDAGSARELVSGPCGFLPILVGWLGGLIAWLVNKDVDQGEGSRDAHHPGIVVSVLLVVLLLPAYGTRPSPEDAPTVAAPIAPPATPTVARTASQRGSGPNHRPPPVPSTRVDP